MTLPHIEARNAMIARGNETDFAAMNGEQFGSWMDRLPMDEFLALISLVDEQKATGQIAPPTQQTVPKPLGPDDNAWIVYTGEGESPLPADSRCYVLFPDGGYSGPNRADAFLWAGPEMGQAQILAYQPA